MKDKGDLTDPGHHVQVAGAAPGFGLGSGSGGFSTAAARFYRSSAPKGAAEAAAAAAATKKVAEDANTFVVTAGALGGKGRQRR